MLKRTLQLLTALTMLSILLGLAGAPAAHASGLCLVNHAASGANNGTSWTDAYTDLQSALHDATCSMVWVAAGVYKPTSTTDRTASFVIPPALKVYGGWVGNETSGFPNPGVNVTILSGDIDNNDTNADGNHIDETAADIQGNNSYHVVAFDGTSSPVGVDTLLSGFTITGGEGNGGGNNDFGGGVWCNGSGSLHLCGPTLQDLTFAGNEAINGGAEYNNGASGGDSSPNLTNVTFSGNAGPTGGPGALENNGTGGTSSPSLTNVTFSGNTAVSAGAMEDDAGSAGTSSPSLTNVTFSGNSASSVAGAIQNNAYTSGNNGTSTPIFRNVIIWGNSAPSFPEVYNFNGVAVPTWSRSIIQGSGGSGGSWDTGLGTDSGGNLDADPKLGPLANNGGTTKTMALLSGSAAVDTGWDLYCPATDQRGARRFQGAHCDIGAVERAQFVRAAFNTHATTDLAVFRPSTGAWYVKNQFNTVWGQSGDVPVPMEYSQAGYNNIAVWRPSTGVWMVKGVFNTAWGQAGDVPVPGDYNGDSKIDLAVFRPSNGTWYVKGVSTTIWGQSGDIPVPGDYNGDGKTDLAVFRPSTGVWYIKGVGNFTWGTSTDIPVQADYNGDTRTDIAIFRPSTGIWYVRGLFNSAWGTSTDIPVPGDFNGDRHADIAVWRPSTGTWYVKSQFTTAWGSSGDFPLVAPDTNGDGTPYQ